MGELLYGAERSGFAHQAANRALIGQIRKQYASLPFNDVAAEHYSLIRDELATRGKMIGANDLLIAAIAVAKNLTLVTHNTNEFSRIACLVTEDWQIP